MAKINGIEIKALKRFADHEGCRIAQGNLYLGGKKLGFWSQDYMCGPDRFDFDKIYDDEKLNNKVKQLNFDKRIEITCRNGSKTFLEYDLDLLLYDLLTLKEEEKFFKKQAKKIGYDPVVIVVNGQHSWNTLSLNAESYTKLSNEQILNLENIKKEIKEIKKEVSYGGETSEVKVTIYRTLKDFDIGEHIKLEDIKTN